MLKKLKIRLICWLSQELYESLAQKYIIAKNNADKYGNIESYLLAEAYAWEIVGLAKLREGKKG